MVKDEVNILIGEIRRKLTRVELEAMDCGNETPREKLIDQLHGINCQMQKISIDFEVKAAYTQSNGSAAPT